MKPIYKYLMGTALSLSFWACDIERTPYDGLTPDKVISTPDGINLAVAGNYSLLKAWSENWHRIFEYPGDNVALSGTTTDNLFFIYNYRRIPNNSRVDAFWRSSYRIIVGVNQVLGATKEGTSADMDQQLGESYYLRGLMHFQMVCAFGKPYAQGRDNPGVPLKLDADALNYPTRSKVGEVYDQVEKDLLKAESLMKVEKTNVYVSKGAIWALLSRLYLYKEDNAKALEYANKVINSGKYSLLNTEQLPDYPKFAPENNSETIFAIKYVLNTDYANSDNGYSTVGSMYATINGSGWGELYASRPYLELIRKFPEDVRNKFISPLADSDFPDVTWAVYTVLSKGSYQYKETEVTKQGDDYVYQDNGTKMLEKVSNGRGGFDYFINTTDGRKTVLIDKKMAVRGGYPKYFILKCSGQEGQAQLWSPVISRLAEMYLNRAEANAKLGKNTDALADVNLIRKRAGIPASGWFTEATLPAGMSVLDIVLQERRLELAYEGHRKMDVFRNKLPMDRRYPGTHQTGTADDVIDWKSNVIVEFLPESQTLVQPGLVQNPN